MDPPADFKDRIKASYDAMAVEYNEWTAAHTHLRLKYLDELLERVPRLTNTDATKPATVLELGCGAGPPLQERPALGGLHERLGCARRGPHPHVLVHQDR
jgi:hypothetical protein